MRLYIEYSSLCIMWKSTVLVSELSLCRLLIVPSSLEYLVLGYNLPCLMHFLLSHNSSRNACISFSRSCLRMVRVLKLHKMTPINLLQNTSYCSPSYQSISCTWIFLGISCNILIEQPSWWMLRMVNLSRIKTFTEISYKIVRVLTQPSYL